MSDIQSHEKHKTINDYPTPMDFWCVGKKRISEDRVHSYGSFFNVIIKGKQNFITWGLNKLEVIRFLEKNKIVFKSVAKLS